MAVKKNNSSDLKTIPGIGKNIEQHLHHIGIETVEDLRGKDPEELYLKDCLFKAVYYAEHETHEPEKLKWWYWKDKEYTPQWNRRT